MNLHRFSFSLNFFGVRVKKSGFGAVLLLILVLVLVLVPVLFLPFRSEAAEVIHRYKSHIVIDASGGLLVTETIEVTAEGDQIKRGIYRDFPLYRRTFLGGIMSAEPSIVSVMRDGEREPYHTEESENNLRLYIGDSGYYLPTGNRYTYEITYSVPDQVFFYDDYDELNWNAIGTGWNFTIEQAHVEIVLPDDAPVLQYSAYTGKVLSRESDVQARPENGRLLIEALQPLEPNEGMTVAVAFPKGYVAASAGMAGTGFFWKQHPGLQVMLIALLIMAVYYYLAWNRVGRDPKSRRRRIVPVFRPPDGISPAMAAFIDKMGGSGKQKNMTAAILSLASKGYLRIEEKGKYTYNLERTEQNPDEGPPISEDERVIYDSIETNLTIKPGSEALVDVASEHHKTLDKLCRKKYYHINGWWWLAGLVPLAAALTIVSFDPNIQAGFLWMGLLFLLTFGGFSLGAIIYAVKQMITGPTSKKAGGILLIIWACIFSMGGFLGFGIMVTMISWLVIACIITMTGLFVVMNKLMKAPTKEGREVMDQIDGLKYYMESVAEKIPQKFSPPKLSQGLFDKYFPYAVALGVESSWTDKFAPAMTDTMAEPAVVTPRHPVPSWYIGGGGSSMSSFSASSMVQSIGTSISAASTSSSSGSGGGGSVGSGGGGGGGGGW